MVSRDELVGLAQVFGEKLLADIGEADLREAIARNEARGVDSMVCHTHDFCDANMSMLAAWQEFFGSEPDVSDESDSAIWNEAWSLAKANGFYLDSAETFVPLADMDAWADWWAANGEAMRDEVGDEATCLALAMNCELRIGGGAAPLFRIGFVD